jgi:hypothetical protein
MTERARAKYHRKAVLHSTRPRRQPEDERHHHVDGDEHDQGNVELLDEGGDSNRNTTMAMVDDPQ